MRIQFTLFSTTGKYRPISTTVEVENIEDLETKEGLDYWKKRAISRIVAQRYKSGMDLIAHGFTKMKWRIYDEQERKQYARQKAIKEFQKNQKKT